MDMIIAFIVPSLINIISIILIIRIFLVHKIRMKALDITFERVGEDIKKLTEYPDDEGGTKLFLEHKTDWLIHYVHYDSYSSSISMILDVRKWTFNKLFPNF
jgi:hypothetical protein